MAMTKTTSKTNEQDEKLDGFLGLAVLTMTDASRDSGVFPISITGAGACVPPEMGSATAR
jgi:hypothetical protein